MARVCYVRIRASRRSRQQYWRSKSRPTRLSSASSTAGCCGSGSRPCDCSCLYERKASTGSGTDLRCRFLGLTGREPRVCRSGCCRSLSRLQRYRRRRPGARQRNASYRELFPNARHVGFSGTDFSSGRGRARSRSRGLTDLQHLAVADHRLLSPVINSGQPACRYHFIYRKLGHSGENHTGKHMYSRRCE